MIFSYDNKVVSIEVPPWDPTAELTWQGFQHNDEKQWAENRALVNTNLHFKLVTVPLTNTDTAPGIGIHSLYQAHYPLIHTKFPQCPPNDLPGHSGVILYFDPPKKWPAGHNIILGVDEWIVRLVQGMYSNARSRVRVGEGYSDEFEVKVGVHQGSVLSPLLFIIVLEALSREFRCGVPWGDLYADDLVIIAEYHSWIL